MSEKTPVSFDMRHYLRMPVFPPDALRAPASAVFHALPASIYVSCHYWLVAAGLLGVLAVSFQLPGFIFWPLALVCAIACGGATWATTIAFIEVEAMLDG